MSAYIVDKAHIDALVTAGLSWGVYGSMSWYTGDPWSDGERRELRHDTADEVGQMLWAENARSVMARYPDIADGGEWPGPIGFSAEEILSYRFQYVPGEVDPLVILKAISCFEYQSCEHREWNTSEAHTFCEVLRHWTIDQLPGISDCPGWDICDRDVFRKRMLRSV